MLCKRIRDDLRAEDVDKAMEPVAQMESLGFILSLGSYVTIVEVLGSVGG